ncbi:integrase core domain-containing protein [Streptomyces murinus]|uniref:integrase core domain-containing protein n=1 Tax=Streptomyces murinus TaxID=33900 RepID=UPI00381B8B78
MKAGATASAGSVADSYDTAMAGALNTSSKAQLTERQGPWRDTDQVGRSIAQWAGWYNTKRLHSAPGYLPPEEFGTQHYRYQAATNTA